MNNSYKYTTDEYYSEKELNRYNENFTTSEVLCKMLNLSMMTFFIRTEDSFASFHSKEKKPCESKKFFRFDYFI